jgi:S-formylglutathione hydrolase FrmB
MPTLHTHTFTSTHLRNNRLGDPATRPLIVYTPPDYVAGQPYPVLFALAAHGNTGRSYLNWKAFETPLPERLDRLFSEAGVPPCVVVMPDCWTRLGGSQYLDSAMGAYESYLTQELVPFIEAHYPSRGRGVFGHSSGGYGALVQALRHPELFQACACHSGDLYWDYTCLPHIAGLHQALASYGGAEAFIRDIPTLPKNGLFWKTLMTLCWCAAHAPNPESPLGFDLPIQPDTGALRADIWARWAEFDPLNMAATEAGQAALRRLKAVYISVGEADEYQLQVGARLLSQALSAAGIAHIFEELPKVGHSGADVPYERGIQVLAEALNA